MEQFAASVVVAATPLLLAATGELVVERAGVLNLGLEGMMLVGAVSAFGVAFVTGSGGLGLVAGAAAGAAMAGLFAALALGLRANQAAVGLALTIFGIGLSGLIGQGLVGQTVTPIAHLDLGWLSQGTVLGRVLLTHDPVVYLALALAGAVAGMLAWTRAGLALRAVGDNPAAAHALGYGVTQIRTLATLFGGAMAGLGGAYLSLAYTPMWGENMTAGRGWIALALVVFATWIPGRLVLGAYLFAAVAQLQFYVQDLALPAQVLAMAPYLATIAALVLISRDATLARINAPAALGKPFHPDR